LVNPAEYPFIGISRSVRSASACRRRQRYRTGR
jgi:hypothetical protein